MPSVSAARPGRVKTWTRPAAAAGIRAHRRFGPRRPSCYRDRVVSPEERFQRVNRLAIRWLVWSVGAGVFTAALGVFFWRLEWAVAAGAGCIAVIWGFLGSLSWASAEGAHRLEAAVAQAALNRRIRAGTAEPERGSISLTSPDATAGLSLPEGRAAVSEGTKSESQPRRL